MRDAEIRRILGQTLDDGRLSRGERKALRHVVEELSDSDRAGFRRRAFEMAHDAAADDRTRGLVAWLEAVTGVVAPKDGGPAPLCEVLSSPGEACMKRIQALVAAAVDTIDVCVYTITDDRIARRIEEAHRRGVTVRILSDDEKASDLGSDIDRFRTSGIPVRLDASSHHMHHKFAVFDGRTALTGSYNWTRSAAEHNQENLVVSDDPRFVRALAEEFERLWARFS